MKLNRRSLLFATAGAALAGCSTPSKRLVIGLTYIPNIQFCAFYHAVDSGLFSKAGLDVELRHHGTQEGLFTALEAGEEQVVFASCDEAMVAAAGGSPVKAFANVYSSYPGCVLGGPSVRSLAELRGRRLGVPGRHGSTWFTALAALGRAGLVEGDVEIVDVGWTQVSALTAGEVDAAVGFANNEAVQLERVGFDVTVIPVLDPEAPELLGPGLMTLPDTLGSTELGKIVEVVAESEGQIMADPTKGITATEKQVPTLAEPEQRATAERVLAATMELWGSNGQVDLTLREESLATMGAFLLEAGIIPKVPELHLPLS